MGKTLYEKVYNDHIVREVAGEVPLIYIDRQLAHEVTSPQAFASLRVANRKLRHPHKTVATMDHNVSTRSLAIDACGPQSETQLKTLFANCGEFGVELFGIGHINQGIVHVMGPEQGLTLPGTTIVCGDSHTATHGAFGAISFGIGTSEVEHVMATQTLKQPRFKTMQVKVSGKLNPRLSAKDIILAVAQVTGSAGGTGYAIEFCGEAIEALSMEGRMTLCNMSIEIGAKVGMIAPDQTTFDYLEGRHFSPKGENWTQAVEYWQTLKSDADAKFDAVVELKAEDITPMITWGTNPGQVIGVNDKIPVPADFADAVEADSCAKARAYMGIKDGEKLTDLKVDVVFVGSCTNARIEDIRAVAEVVKGHQVAQGVEAIVVPGSGLVRQQAEKEGLDKILIAAGFEWRLPGCSMCLAMNDDRLGEGLRCASTSNRNFEGRQGRGGRTHLVSPAMAGAAAIKGKFTDIREFN